MNRPASELFVLAVACGVMAVVLRDPTWAFLGLAGIIIDTIQQRKWSKRK